MDRAQRLMSNSEGVDAIVVMNGSEPFLDSTFWYLTELDSGTFEGSVAVVSKDGSLDVVTGRLEETCARNGKGRLHIYETRAERDEILRSVFEGVAAIGMNVRSVTHAGAEFIKRISGAEIRDATDAILRTVSVKERKEIDSIAKACDIASRVAAALPGILDSRVTEKEAAAWIGSEMARMGADGPAFRTISAFGRNSAEPHHRPCGTRLAEGDAALFDFGCRYGMYCSDLTRTVFYGPPGPMMKRAYEVVLKAKEKGMEAIRDGAAAKDADAAARSVIDASEFKGSFIHSFGHGVGMDVHEGISLSAASEDVLRENMVVTAEPGVYIPGVGGVRIEDTVLVTRDGCRPLTDFDQDMTVI